MDKQTIPWRIGETSSPLPPKLPGLPLFGNALDMRHDPTRYIVDMYLLHGPIFRAQILNRSVTFLAGLEANRFAAQHDEEVFTNAVEFAGLREEIGPAFTSSPPEEHGYMRRLMRPAYARSLALQHIPLLVQVVDAFVDKLQPGDSFEVFPTMQELVVTQLGLMLLGQAPGEYFEDFRRFMLTVLQVHQFHIKPRLALKLPGYRRAKARSFEMAQQVLDRVRSAPPGRTAWRRESV